MKLINLPHKVCSLTCMINGLEDLYELAYAKHKLHSPSAQRLREPDVGASTGTARPGRDA